jgi:hypothetical protein
MIPHAMAMRVTLLHSPHLALLIGWLLFELFFTVIPKNRCDDRTQTDRP